MSALVEHLRDAWSGLVIMYKAGALDRAIAVAFFSGAAILGYYAGRAARRAEELDDEAEWLEIVNSQN